MIFFFFLCSAIIFSQSLVELAKREKERRAKLSEKSSIVITNADLKNTKKIPALIISSPHSSQKNSTASQTAETGSLSPRVSVSGDDYQIDQREFDKSSKKYATEVLQSTERVRNPALSLKKPDGNFAEIEYFGFLDLKLEAENKSGGDIAVYAKRQQTGVLPFTMNYGLFAMDSNGEWKYIGTGSGVQSRETFELGEISKTQRIRIVFRDYTDMNTIKRIKPHSEEYYMGIDAVEFLHF